MAALEEHTIREPCWIKALIEEVVIEAVYPLGFIGPLGYRWWEPEHPYNTFTGWQLAVFPTPNELVGPNALDGAKTVSGFYLDVYKLTKSLSDVEQIIWRSPVNYKGDLDGPEISIQGKFAGKRVWLRFFHLPPADEPCTFILDPSSGEAKPKPLM